MVMENLTVANQTILESCTNSIIRLDDSGKIISISNELCQLAGLDVAQLTGRHASEAGPVIQHLLDNSGTVEIQAQSDSRYQFNHSELENQSDAGTVHIFTNITTMMDLHNENQRLKEEARQLQLIDQDTSLLTKRALLLVLESQVSRCRRYETPLSVFMMSFNKGGDRADLKLQLLKLGRLLKDQLRWSDMIARSADRQFTIILPETDRSSSDLLINKLKETIKLWGEDYRVCFGQSEWKKGINASDLLSQCEHELADASRTTSSGQDVA